MQTPLPNLWNDLRYSLRQLRRAPVFTLTAVLTLALGIGANTAIFSLLDQALLRSLPVQDSRQLVILEGTGKAWEGHSSSYGGDAEAYFSYPMYRELRERNQAFQDLLATTRAQVGFTRRGASQVTPTELVSGNYFTLLGVRPALGRVFTQTEDNQPNGNPVAVLSFEFWNGHLGADPTIVGETVSINGHPFQIIGVSAARFNSAIWGEHPALFVPMSMLGQIVPGSDSRLTNHRDRWMNIIGRLKAGESREQAQVAIAPLWHALRAEELKALGTKSKRFTDEFLTNSRLLVLPGARGFSYDRDDYKQPLLAVMSMALLVLLIATVNVSSLLLVRSASRVREFSLRFALGARASRVIQQLLIEGFLIGIGGGLAGIVLASFAIRTLVHRLAGTQGPGDFSPSIDSRLLLFNFAVALIVSVAFSLAPTLQLRRPDINTVLGQRSTTGTGGNLLFRRAVVSLQIGLSVVLIVAAGLFVRTMQNLRSVNVGFTTTHLVGFGINPKLAGYPPQAILPLYRQLLDTLKTIPGVQTVGVTDNPELAGDNQGSNVTVDGYTPPPDDDFDVERSFVSPDYFSTLQIPLLAGRYLNESDDATHPLVAIVNQSFVKHFCKSTLDCLGRHMAGGGGDKVKLDTEIIGVVRDNRHSGLRDAPVATWFRPIPQQPDTASLYFYLRTYSDPAQTLSTVRRTMQQFDSKLALYKLRTVDDQIEDNLTSDRVVVLLAISFGVLAALLAGVGIYGVLAYSTAQRTREIGIRIALGSSRIAISRIILSDVFVLAGIGIVFAIPCAYGLSHLVQSQLYGVSPADPVSLLSAIVLVAIVAVTAALIPASRAASVDPNEALRTE